MTKRIVKAFIDDLLNRIDIINVINTRVPLKKAGKDYQACCPFHNEKTPSFTVSVQKQFYYCFGCHAKGNAIGFLMAYENLQFVEAVEKLAEENNITVEYEQLGAAEIAKAEQRKTLYDILEEVTALYEKNLYDNRLGTIARHYLLERQLDKETSEFFRLGYSQTGNTLKSCLNNSITNEDLQKVGLLNHGERGFYDFFRDRLMFPIRDPRGRVIGFGARALENDTQPKYLNTGDTTLFNKSQVLYGLYEELQTNRHIEHLIIVEGYMDVIALHQMGVQGAVATLGTAFTAGHLQLLHRYSKKIYICFDGDNAGKQAAERAMRLILPVIQMDMEIRMIFLPDGEDPDTLVRKIGKTAFIEQLSNGQLFSEFVYATLIADSNLQYVEGRGEIATRAKKLFDDLPNSEYKTILYQGLTERVGMDIYHLADKQLKTAAAKQVTRTSRARVSPKLSGGLESRLISLLLAQPELVLYVNNECLLADSEKPDREILYRLIQFYQVQYQGGEQQTQEVVFSAFDKDSVKRLAHITATERLVEKTVNESLESVRLRRRQDFVMGLEKLLNGIQRKLSLQ